MDCLRFECIESLSLLVCRLMDSNHCFNNSSQFYGLMELSYEIEWAKAETAMLWVLIDGYFSKWNLKNFLYYPDFFHDIFRFCLIKAVRLFLRGTAIKKKLFIGP